MQRRTKEVWIKRRGGREGEREEGGRQGQGGRKKRSMYLYEKRIYSPKGEEGEKGER